MAELLTNSADLRQKASTLAELNAQFKAQVNQLESTEQTLIGMWDGDAKQSFDSAFKSDKIQMDNFYNAIQQYVQVLEQIAANYDTAEATNVSTANTRKY